MRVVNLRG